MTVGQEDVLVVGAGPTGLVLAAELALASVAAQVIDRAPQPGTSSRAIGVGARTVEVLDGLGLAEAALERGRRLTAVSPHAEGRVLTDIALDRGRTPFPFVLCLSQRDTESLLADRVEQLGVKIERGITLSALTGDRDIAHATLTHADGGVEHVAARWVIGCDGAHSSVRGFAGIPMRGADLPQRFVLADVPADWTLSADRLRIYFHPDGVLGVIPLPAPGWWRLAADVADDREPALDRAELERLVATRSPLPQRIGEPAWTSDLRVRERHAVTYRNGPILLAGDAAHVHSPVGGQGMNTGIQDAHNLAWKLALVARGLASESLLDSYHSERAPVARAVLATTRRSTTIVALRNPLLRRARRTMLGLVGRIPATHRLASAYLGELLVRYHPATRLRGRFAGTPRPGELFPDVPVTVGGERTRSRQVLADPVITW